jgi:hypothetical protein
MDSGKRIKEELRKNVMLELKGAVEVLNLNTFLLARIPISAEMGLRSGLA